MTDGAGGAMRQERYADVWDALEDTPEAAAEMRLRSELMIRVQEEVAAWGLTQAATAGRLGVTQPRLTDLLRGRVGKFSLGALVDLAACAGVQARGEMDRVAG